MVFRESESIFFSFFKYPFNMYIYNGVKMSMAKVLQVSYRWVAFQGLYFVSVISATSGSQAVPLGKGHCRDSLVLLTI